MWCAGLFAILALAGLPKALSENNLVDWLIQDFLQLVLMSVILVGQDVQSKKTEKLIKETHKASTAEFEIAKRNQELASQELEELRLISADIHRIISELEARQSLKATSLESGRAATSLTSPEQNIPMG
jgi:predicted HTH transcriptional regulator